MEFTWGLFVFFILLVIPGLLARKLYYFSEFSKQFGEGESVLKIVSFGLIPGLVILIISFFIYDLWIQDIDLGLVIDSFKDFGESTTRYKELGGTTLKQQFFDCVFPFLMLTYFIAFILGGLSGRLIRITNLDTKFKLLRFRNHWFYLFNGHHNKLKKYKSNNVKKGSRFLFTQADVLVNTNNSTALYSGIIKDYELNTNNYNELSRIVLGQAKRYKHKDGKTIVVNIPGEIFVIDCKNLVNLNLTYIYGESKDFLKSIWPKIIFYIFAVICVLLLPFFFIQFNLNWDFYTDIFEMSWVGRSFYYFFIIQVFTLFNPFIIDNKSNEVKLITWGVFCVKLVWVGSFFLTYLFIEWLSQVVLSWF